MEVVLTILISVIALGSGFFFGVSTLRISKNKENIEKGKEAVRESNAMVIITLELKSISDGIAEIKAEMNSVKTDTRSNADEIIRIGESLKSAWKRIDIIETKKPAHI